MKLGGGGIVGKHVFTFKFDIKLYDDVKSQPKLASNRLILLVSMAVAVASLRFLV